MLSTVSRFRPRRSDWLQAGLVALALFVFYAACAPRTVALEDDGLFILSSYFLGVEHPPGYPLFTLIGHLFSRLPFGSVAWRVHVASGFFGGLSCGLAWLCARTLIPGRTGAYVAAIGLGLSPVFWSQAIIAEVYTLNTFFFLLLVFLGMLACPPGAQDAAAQRRLLPWMAVIFGLSLSNHYPLMLLVAPASLILLWPARQALLDRFGVLSWLFLAGLLPYVWLVYRSWAPLPISFYGPLESPKEIWFFVSRAGYAGIDQSVTASWLDRIKLFQFQAAELFVQFALVGTLLAGVGFAAQWRVLGRRIAAFLTLAFLMSTAMLILLLGFDYDSMHKHIYQVYPLPAYAVAALWMGLGAVWLMDRFALRRWQTVAAPVLLLLAIFAVGGRENFLEDHEWGARFARAVLKAVPAQAVVFGQGDPDLVPMAYFHMIEQWRPDITLYHSKGLVLGNRLFHPERTDAESQQRILRDMVEHETRPIVSTLGVLAGAQRDYWLYSQLDKSSRDSQRVTVVLTPAAKQFFDDWVAQTTSSNAWVAFIQGELRRRYGVLLARSLHPGMPLDEQTRRELDLLGKDFYGALGLAEGQMLNPQGYAAGAVVTSLEQARQLMPSDVAKEFLSRFFYIRGALRANAGEQGGAIEDMETAITVLPRANNPAVEPLEELYRKAGNEAALNALHQRVKALKSAG